MSIQDINEIFKKSITSSISDEEREIIKAHLLNKDEESILKDLRALRLMAFRMPEGLNEKYIKIFEKSVFLIWISGYLSILS